MLDSAGVANRSIGDKDKGGMPAVRWQCAGNQLQRFYAGILWLADSLRAAQNPSESAWPMR